MQGHQELSEAEDVARDQLHLREISLPSLTLALAENESSLLLRPPLLLLWIHFLLFFEHKWARAKILLFYESSSINKRKKPIVILGVFTSTLFSSLSRFTTSPRCSIRRLEVEPFFRTSTARDCLPSGGTAILSCPPTPRARKYQRN